MFLYSCEKNSETLTSLNPDTFEVEQRMMLPDCESISVEVSMKDPDCCYFSINIWFEGSNPPEIRLNGNVFTDFPPALPGYLGFNLEVCSESAFLEVIGLDEKGEEAVCWSKELICRTCCSSTSLQVISASNNSNTGCCRYRVRAENNSLCEFNPVVGGAYHQTLFPGDVRAINVTNCVNQDPVDVYLVDSHEAACKVLTLDCTACCDLGGTVGIRVSHNADASPENPGCCIWKVTIRNPSDCNLDLHLNGEFNQSIPSGFNDTVEVEVCGFGFSTLSVVNTTGLFPPVDVQCLSVELENVCSE